MRLCPPFAFVSRTRRSASSVVRRRAGHRVAALSGAVGIAGCAALHPGHAPTLPRRDYARVAATIPRKTEGAGKAGCPLHPQPGVRKMRAHQHSHHRFNRISPAFPARMVLTVSFVISSVSRALLPPSPTENRKLDISVGMSGPHDFAVRVSTVRLAAPRVHRIPRSTSVTMRNAPPIEAGCAGITTDLA